MEADLGEEIDDSSAEESVTQQDRDDTQILEELVYPFELTARMINLYSDPAYNRENLGEAYPQVLLKLYRSIRFWREKPPAWLVNRVRDLLSLEKI